MIAPVLVILLVAGALWAFLGRKAPPGKVWSEEHGHWHDAPGGSPGSPAGFTPPPEGPAPDGKVWSYEHGHWHDAEPLATQPPVDTGGLLDGPETIGQDAGASVPDAPAGLVSQPPGPAPEGKVWSPDHGHWHDVVVTPQPPGPAPAGKVWSPEHGHWHDSPQVITNSPINLTPQPPGPVPEGKVWSPEHGHWHAAPGAEVNQPPPPTPVIFDTTETSEDFKITEPTRDDPASIEKEKSPSIKPSSELEPKPKN